MISGWTYSISPCIYNTFANVDVWFNDIYNLVMVVWLVKWDLAFVGYVHTWACFYPLEVWLVGLKMVPMGWLRLVIGLESAQHFGTCWHAPDITWQWMDFWTTSNRWFYYVEITTQWISSTFERILGVAVWFFFAFPAQMIPNKRIQRELIYSGNWSCYKNQLTKFFLDNESHYWFTWQMSQFHHFHSHFFVLLTYLIHKFCTFHSPRRGMDFTHFCPTQKKTHFPKNPFLTAIEGTFPPNQVVP